MFIIELNDIWKIYHIGSSEIYALKNVSLCIEEGEFHCIIGPSGSGKSTLLNIISGIEKPDKGIVKVCGIELNKLNDNELAKFRSKYIGFVFQQFYLIPRMSILENVELPLMLHNLPRNIRKRLALEALELVGLKEFANRKPNQLSGGEQQRVAIARAIVTKPKILLADEPTGNLDVENTRKVMEIFVKLNSEYKITIVLATHNIELLKFCTRITQLRNGEVIRTYVKDEIPELIRKISDVLK